MDRRVPDGGFLVADALAGGATRDMLRRRSLVAPARGVRLPAADAHDLRARCRAIGLSLPAGTGFSHTTAAALWGLPVPRSDDPAHPVHVLGPPGRYPTTGARIRSHRGARPGDIVHRDGVPVTSPVRTWADGSGSWSGAELLAITDALLSRSTMRVSRDDLGARSATWAGHRGARALREVLPLTRHFVDSPMESLTRWQLLASGFPCPVVGADVFDDRGCWIARPDRCWPEIRVAIEYDGEHHRTDRHQYAKDIHRKEQLEDAGWRCVVLLSHDVLRRWGVTEARLNDVVASRGARPRDLTPAQDTTTRPRIVTRRPIR